MTPSVVTTLASAGTLCALALLVALSLVLKGLALQPRSLGSRLARNEHDERHREGGANEETEAWAGR